MKHLFFLVTLSIFTSCSILKIGGNRVRKNIISFDILEANNSFKIQYQKDSSEYLAELLEKHPIDTLFSQQETDLNKILKVMNWTNSRWNHDGNNSPSKFDAITILDEVSQGEEFPCFAYSIVLKDMLNAIGLKARTIYLKTKNAQHSNKPSGHVATEVFLEDYDKWVFLDAQFNILPIADKTPLNAVEFQSAITNQNTNLKLLSLNKKGMKDLDYYVWIYRYLNYFDTHFDHRYDLEKQNSVNGKFSLMLVPKESKPLTKMKFYKSDVSYCAYTNNLNDFYRPPEF